MPAAADDSTTYTLYYRPDGAHESMIGRGLELGTAETIRRLLTGAVRIAPDAPEPCEGCGQPPRPHCPHCSRCDTCEDCGVCAGGDGCACDCEPTPGAAAGPLSAARLAEIRQRFEGIAHFLGPWEVSPAADGSDSWLIGYPTNNPLAGLIATVPDYGAALAEFVAHARTDVPALLAAAVRLRAERDALCDRVDTLTAVAKGNKRHVAELYGDLHHQLGRAAALERRVAELVTQRDDALAEIARADLEPAEDDTTTPDGAP